MYTVYIPASNGPSSHSQDAFGVLAWIFGDCRDAEIHESTVMSIIAFFHEVGK